MWHVRSSGIHPLVYHLDVKLPALDGLLRLFLNDGDNETAYLALL